MKLEKQVPTLETSKKLHKLLQEKGDVMESYFWWDARHINLFTKKDGNPFFSKEIVSAYTVSELGEMLPAKVEGSYIETSRCQDNSGFNCNVGYINGEAASFCEKTEAEARAKMLIYLLENNLI